MDPCAICNRPTEPGRRYLVAVHVTADVTADPEPVEETYEDLVKQLQSYTGDDAQDAVHRDFTYHVCPTCQPKVLANPLGLPRLRVASRN